MAHAFIKGPTTLKPHAVAKPTGDDEALPVGADEALEVTLATWKKYWQDPEREVVLPESFPDGGDKLPQITVEMFDQACREIGEGSGLSWGNPTAFFPEAAPNDEGEMHYDYCSLGSQPAGPEGVGQPCGPLA